jgi:hypothetical protein
MAVSEKSVSDYHVEEAERKVAERQALDAELASNTQELEGLCLAAENGDAGAQARIEWLEQREVTVRRLIKQKLVAERDLRQKADEARDKEAIERDRRRRQGFLKRAASLPARAKELERGMATFLTALNGYVKAADDLQLAYADSWPFKGPANLYPERVKAFIAHHLYVAMQDRDVKAWPSPAYSQQDWQGLEAQAKATVAWFKAALGSDTLPVPEHPEYAQPDPVPASEAPADEVMMMSGREFQKCQDFAASLTQGRQALHTELNPFTGEPL